MTGIVQTERGDNVKGNKITPNDMARLDKMGWFPVACRICGGVMLFPKGLYSKKDLDGWECGGALSKQCNNAKIMRKVTE